MNCAGCSCYIYLHRLIHLTSIFPTFVDVNECSKVGVCSNGQCVNTIGSFQCNCDRGYILAMDMKTCEGRHVVSLHCIAFKLIYVDWLDIHPFHATYYYQRF